MGKSNGPPDDPAGALREARAICGRVLVAAAGFSFAINLLMLATPLYTLQLYDRVLSSRSLDTLMMLSLLMLGALAALGALEAVRGSLFARLAGRVEQVLGPALVAAGVDAGRRGRSGAAAALRDLPLLRQFLTGPATQALLDAPWTPVFVAAVFLVDPVLGWIALGGSVGLLGLAVVNDLLSRRIAHSADEAGRRVALQAEDAARNADVVEALGMLPAVIARFRESEVDMLTRQAAADGRRVALGGLSRFVRLTLQAGVLGVGAYLAIGGRITPGGMIAASILAGRALAPVDLAIGSWRAMIAARAAYRRICRRLIETRAGGQAMDLPRPEGRLGVEDLNYRHDEDGGWALRAVSFALEPGQALGVVGPPGAGKTTLARMLVGNLTPATGAVRLDGIDLATWRGEARGRHLGYLPQSVELFPATVRENIARMGQGDPAAVVQAARLVGAHDMILSLPQGYDTRIGEGGCALSGGQRQWIGLARAAYGEPRLVVLDEPNSNLDGQGEQAILAAIEAWKAGGAAVVIIAHRASILQKTDRILALADGRQEMLGERSEVMQGLMRRSADRRAAAHA